jgi:uncharacterized protein (TIGR02118 family)
MIRFSVLYPDADGATFDHDYYRDKHVPLALRTWGLETAEIDKGVSGPYVAAVHFFFDSMEALGAALGAEGTAAVADDVQNYTSITPVHQVSEVTS